MFNRIEFVIAEAFSALSRNRLMTFAAVTTVAVSLFLFGGMGYAYFRISKFADSIPGKFRMLVYLKDDASKEDVARAATQIRAIPAVESASWIPRDKAWERWKKEHPTSLTEGVENPLPEGFRVIISDLKESDNVVAAIRANPLVAKENGVKYLKDEQNFVDGLLTALRLVGAVVGGILFLIAGVLIYNAIRLTVLSRRLEIRIMQLVGASRATVYVPFLIEGMLQGVIGGILASGLVYGAYTGFNKVMGTMVSIDYTPAPFAAIPVVCILTGAGALYGIFCSTLAIRAPLKYR